MENWPAFIAVWILVALIGWAAVAAARYKPRRKGKPGGFQIVAAVLLGIGEPVDPPSKHVAEANADNPREGDDTGDPPKT
jgi:hypothetical protein